tara:strand:- start:114 stop:515 length:402 start_codon:yes stop_codon:yes gene_type:complete
VRGITAPFSLFIQIYSFIQFFIQMAKTRKLTLTYPDGTKREPTTARNYMYAVHITRRDENLKPWYSDEFLCGREDLMRKTVSKYRNADPKTLIEIATLTFDPWLAYPERAKKGFKPYEMPNAKLAAALMEANK